MALSWRGVLSGLIRLCVELAASLARSIDRVIAAQNLPNFFRVHFGKSFERLKRLWVVAASLSC